VLEVQHALQNSTLSAQHALLFWTQHISYNRQIYLITYMCNIHMFVATIRARKASTPLDAPPPPTPEHEAASQPLPCHSRRPHWPCISPARPCRHRPTRLPSRSPCHHRSSFTSEEAEDDSDDPDEDDSDAKSDYEREEIARRGVHGDRRLHTTSERRPSSTASQRHAGAKPPRHVPLLPQPIASPRLGLGVRRPQPPHHEREEMAGRGARGDRRLHRRTVEQCITLMRGLLGMRRIHRRTLKAVVAQNAHLGKAPHHRQDQGDVHCSQPGRSGEARAQSPARRLPPFIAASETSPPIEFLPTTTIALSRCAAACSEPTQLPSSARALSWYGSPPFQSFRSIGRDV
jgi:hypothetical protein